MSLHFAYYNFCRVHQTLGTTPAVAAGVTDHVWTLNGLIGLLEAAEATPIKRSPYRLEADVRLSLRWGKLDPVEARRTLQKAKSAPLEKVKKAREWFTENVYDPVFLAKLRDGRKAIRDAGGVIPDG